MILKITTASTQGLTYSVVREGAKGEVVDLSFVTAEIMVKASPYDKDSKALIRKQIVHPKSNLVYFELSAEETAKMAAGKYSLSFRLVYDSGKIQVLREDTLLVSKGVFDA